MGLSIVAGQGCRNAGRRVAPALAALPGGSKPLPRPRQGPMLGPPRPDARRLGPAADALFLKAMALSSIAQGAHNIAWDDHLGHWTDIEAYRAKAT